MAEHRYLPLAAICIILILACQICSVAAHSNQESEWVTKHLSQPHGERVVTQPSGHLQESKTQSRRGHRATLVDESRKLHNRLGLSALERVLQMSKSSWTRAYALDAKARAAAYVEGTSSTKTGRKPLQVAEGPAEPPSSFDSSVTATAGSYSMTLSIGTPPQHFVVIADTGSDLVWIQCQACTLCYEQQGPFFQPNSSSTYATQGCTAACNFLGTHALQCNPTCVYNIEYGSGRESTQGDFSTDTVTLQDFDTSATTLVPNFNFGCGLQDNGTFAGVDGYVGLGRLPFSFPSQIAPYLNNHSIFSYCLVDKSSQASSTIIFGEDAVPSNSTGLVYTPLLSPFNVTQVGQYYVNLTGISVGSVNLSIPIAAFQTTSNGTGGTIFDSGTTYTQLVSAAYNPLKKELQAQITQYPVVDLVQQTGLHLCFNISGLISVTIPGIVFYFENANFPLNFDNIMVIVAERASEGTAHQQYTYMCLGMQPTSNMNIYGNTQQTDYQIVYDLDAQRIGWRYEDCATFGD